MQHPIEAALANPWQTLRWVIGEPLHPGGRDATESLLDRARVDDTTTLLDVGCGAGEALALAAERGATVLGVDPKPTGGPSIQGRGGSLPLRDASVDVGLAECVLCLSEDVDQSLSELNRVIAPGGRLAISDMVQSETAPRLPSQVTRPLCLDRALPTDDLLERVEAAGFVVESVHDHHDDLLAMRDRAASRVDYRGFLRAFGEKGTDLLADIDRLDAALDAKDIGYVSFVATRTS